MRSTTEWKDWTVNEVTHRCNSSELFYIIRADIERTIRGGAFDLIAGNADVVAGIVLARLAHKYRLGPTGEINEDIP